MKEQANPSTMTQKYMHQKTNKQQANKKLYCKFMSVDSCILKWNNHLFLYFPVLCYILSSVSEPETLTVGIHVRRASSMSLALMWHCHHAASLTSMFEFI